MPQARDKRHIIVQALSTTTPYTPHDRAIDPPLVPSPANRAQHAQQLKLGLEQAVLAAQQRRAAVGQEIPGVVPGMYVQFDSQPGVQLNLTSLERPRSGMFLASVNEVDVPTADGPKTVQRATVFVPERVVEQITRRFDQYAEDPGEGRNPRHKDAIERVATLRLATLRGLWTDADDVFPRDGGAIWWEVWLLRNQGHETARFTTFAEKSGLVLGQRVLAFDDRVVVLAFGTAAQLAASMDVLADVAEVRRAKEAASFFDSLLAEEQAEWVDELADRIVRAPEYAPAVCLLDTGVNRGHPLLADALAADDVHTLVPAWGVHDHHGHGTAMAGLALFGDLGAQLVSPDRVSLRHVLESVKLLPPPQFAANRPDLYGALTAEATSRVELQAPWRRRAFAMAVAATDERDRGQPTSWSAAIDALAAGRSFDAASSGLVYLDDESNPRLLLLAVGNVCPGFDPVDHLEVCDSEAVHDPAQAWNAVAVGALTHLTALDPTGTHAGWEAQAPHGELSPFSSTSVEFDVAWPVKPDVVFEGGNTALAVGDLVEYPVADLSLLTTYHDLAARSFDLMFGTSAATAQVARLAALITAEYPELWPETVRGMIVHAAEWTPAMAARMNATASKRARAKLLRRYGYGEPRLERALRSAKDALTLIAQGSIRPYEDGKYREVCYHELPWPKEALEALGHAIVRLRVTLSYFIEPNPARRGWTKRYRYASHGLRFEVMASTEDVETFQKRVNKQALDDGERKPAVPGQAGEWFLGEQARNKGSLHADFWTGTARDLAARGVIAVYPVGGWWKDQTARDRSHLGARYALIVSIETTAVEADIWTPVAAQVEVPIEVAEQEDEVW